MIDYAGGDPDSCGDGSYQKLTIGVRGGANIGVVPDAKGTSVGPVTYTSSGTSFPIIVEFGSDYDGDSTADSLDNDDDGDGVPDNVDGCQFGHLFQSRLSTDRDEDGCRDSDEDNDDDNDGKQDSVDQCPSGVMYWHRNTTTDFDDDGCNDASEDFNDDNDGFQDFEDLCPRLYGNSTYVNEKGCPDDDGDGRANMTDPFPNDSSEWKDSDSDGVGDNSDAFPLDATQDSDSDNDSYGDNTYGNFGDWCPLVNGNSSVDVFGCVDSDGDGYSNLGDDFPNNPTQHQDRDGDGYGDNPTGTDSELVH